MSHQASSAATAYRRALLRCLPAALALHTFGCQKMEALNDDAEPDPDTPFSVSILGSESCPLPAGLDPKKVAIVSYRVRITAHASGGIPANYFYASLLTTDGNRYLADFPGCSPNLHGAPLKPGETVDGFFNFPVPPSKTPEKLVYAPELTKYDANASTLELPIMPPAAGQQPPPEDR